MADLSECYRRASGSGQERESGMSIEGGLSMTDKGRAACSALVALGVKILPDDMEWHDGAEFRIWIDGSSSDEDGLPWGLMHCADSLPDEWVFGVNPRVTDILDANGLWCEWGNSEVLNIYKDHDTRASR